MKLTSYRFGDCGDQTRGFATCSVSVKAAMPFAPIVCVPSRTVLSPNLPVIVARWERFVTFLRLIRIFTLASHVPHGSSGRTSTRWKSTVSSFLR